MSISELQLNNFKDIFVGNAHNYGQHTYNFSSDGEKEKGTNKTITNKLLTITPYKDHLNGKKGLGIIPIDSDNKCKFAVIDIDVYNKDFSPYLSAIERHNFPIVPFTSKSGGYHLYTFFKKKVKAKDAVERMKKMSRILGISLFVKENKNETVEIFIKQVKLNTGEIGNWINLPYYNAEKTKQGLIKNGEILNFNSALMHIKVMQTTIEEIDELLNDLIYNDAPPCLQTLYLLNMLDKDSGRNNYLFSFGVYLKKKDENYFEQNVIEINNALKQPLPIKEIEQTILQSLRKKDYTYKCTASPCLDFCDKKVCQKRKYGIGKNDGYFTNLILGKMVQFNSASPYYEWYVKTEETKPYDVLRFKNEDEIIKQDAFLKLCFRKLHFLPFKMKQSEWFKLVNQNLVNMEVIDVAREDDTAPLVILHNMFYEFLTERTFATTRQQILAGRVFYDKRKRSYYFRIKDFIKYVYEYKNFRAFSSGEIHGILRDLKVTSKTLRIESKQQIRVAQIEHDKVAKGLDGEYTEDGERIKKDAFKVDFSAFDSDTEQF